MSEHTPGPWYFDPDDGAYVTDGPESRPFQHNICQVMGDWSRPEIQANGRLLAAAPELLAALVALTDYTAGEAMFQRGANGPWQIEDAQLGRLIEASRDAIDKAEGRQP